MSEEPAKPAEPPPAAGKTSKLVVALLVLNLGASGFGVFRLLTAEPAAAAPVPHAPPPMMTSEVTGPVFGIEPFVVNLDEPGQSRYLKVTLQLELATAEAEAALTRSKQLVRDAILSHL